MAIFLEYEVSDKLKLSASADSEKIPITTIIVTQSPTNEKVEFCYRVLQRTLKALLTQNYSEFDAQTTTNCCHGMSLLVRELIILSNQEDLEGLLKVVTEKIQLDQIDSDFTIQKPIINLCQLYILNYIRNICDIKGVRTSAAKLKLIMPLGTAFYDNLVKKLQKHYSNQIAFQYEFYLQKTIGLVKTCGIPSSIWGKYISFDFLKKSSRGIFFASCLYSMQVCLANLILSKAKIAVVNNIYEPQGELSKRYIRLLQGNGIDGFEPIHPDQNKELEYFSDEPVIVFAGCAHNKNPDFVTSQMGEWINRFPNLVLACDTYYPQFPEVYDDPHFQNTPIAPKEKFLQKIIDQHRELDGVSAKDPSLYCLNHVYPSSLKQILSDDVTVYKIPKVFSKSESPLSQ